MKKLILFLFLAMSLPSKAQFYILGGLGTNNPIVSEAAKATLAASSSQDMPGPASSFVLAIGCEPFGHKALGLAWEASLGRRAVFRGNLVSRSYIGVSTRMKFAPAWAKGAFATLAVDIRHDHEFIPTDLSGLEYRDYWWGAHYELGYTVKDKLGLRIYWEDDLGDWIEGVRCQGLFFGIGFHP